MKDLIVWAIALTATVVLFVLGAIYITLLLERLVNRMFA